MRIVSLVPSLTESLWEIGVGPRVVGVTKFCVHPENARTNAAVVGGTKDPNIEAIRSLKPDLVLADEDENKPEHLKELEAFTKVHVTRIQTVTDVAQELAVIGRLVGREHDAEARAQTILQRASELRSVASLAPRLAVFVPIWRTPLMTIGGRTYMADLVRLAGGRTIFDSSSRKYFETSFQEARAQGPEAALLPTEPYRFREQHRAEVAGGLNLPLERVRIVDGQAFTWFGTRTLQGLEAIPDALRLARMAPA